MDPYQLLGQVLAEIRHNLQELHPGLQSLVRQAGMRHWYDRPEPGWSHRELSELSHFLVQLKDCPAEVQDSFSTTFVWRLENGIPCNRRLVATYCYILGFRLEFSLIPLANEADDGAHDESA